jgi:hypothetical protein
MVPAIVRLIDNKPQFFRKIHSAEEHEPYETGEWRKSANQ